MAVYGRSRPWSTQQPVAVGGGGGGAVWRGNEPVGMTLVSSQDFTTMPSSGWAYFSGASTISDATAPRSPSSVFHANVTAESNSAGLTEKDLSATPWRTLYCCMWIKLSTNWQGHGTTTNKLGFLFIGSGGSQNKFFWRATGTGSNPLSVGIALQAVVAGGNFDAGVTGLYDSNLDNTVVYRRGQWDLLEWVATANTTGNADGGVEMYLNGTHCSSCSGIEWTTDASPKWSTFQCNILWGGGDGSTISSPGSTFANIDEVYLSGKN